MGTLGAAQRSGCTCYVLLDRAKLYSLAQSTLPHVAARSACTRILPAHLAHPAPP